MVNIFIATAASAKKSLHEQFFALLGKTCNLNCYKIGDADLIVVRSRGELSEIYAKDRHIAIFSEKEITDLPENVRWIPPKTFLRPMENFLEFIEKRISRDKAT